MSPAEKKKKKNLLLQPHQYASSTCVAQGSLAQPKLSSAVLTGHSIKTTHSCWFYASWQHTGLEYRLQHSEEGRHTSGSRSGSTTIKSASAQAWSAASGSMLGITFPSTASSSKRRMWQIVYLSITQISHANITRHSDRTLFPTRQMPSADTVWGMRPKQTGYGAMPVYVYPAEIS